MLNLLRHSGTAVDRRQLLFLCVTLRMRAFEEVDRSPQTLRRLRHDRLPVGRQRRPVRLADHPRRRQLWLHLPRSVHHGALRASLAAHHRASGLPGSFSSFLDSNRLSCEQGGLWQSAWLFVYAAAGTAKDPTENKSIGTRAPLFPLPPSCTPSDASRQSPHRLFMPLHPRLCFHVRFGLASTLEDSKTDENPSFSALFPPQRWAPGIWTLVGETPRNDARAKAVRSLLLVRGVLGDSEGITFIPTSVTRALAEDRKSLTRCGSQGALATSSNWIVSLALLCLNFAGSGTFADHPLLLRALSSFSLVLFRARQRSGTCE